MVLWYYVDMVLWYSVDMVIWCEGIFLYQQCNTLRFISLSKHLENTRRYDLQDIHVMKNQLKSLTEELISLSQYQK